MPSMHNNSFDGGGGGKKKGGDDDDQVTPQPTGPNELELPDGVDRVAGEEQGDPKDMPV